ncbi:MAG: MBL fold metallo-hydrolase [Opitutales bacterium]|nr:MBL fold metallo-hydrolase [Opitutales bacterium]
MRFCILGSSSAGNCALLQTPRSRVLIDAGFSARRTKQMLAELGQSLDDIDAVFITHDHSDHCGGLKGLCKVPNLKVFATYQTSCAAQGMMPESKIDWKIFEANTRFQFQDISVQSFSVPHDAYETVGYLFTTGDGSAGDPVRSTAWMTDLGHIPPRAAAEAAKADILVIEANHDLKMLEESNRPFHLKQRIRGRHGHLSNDATLDYLRNAKDANWKHIFLAHISNECNDPSLVRRMFGESLCADGSCPISVVHPRLGCGDIVEIGPWERVNTKPDYVAPLRQAMLFE